MTLDSLRKHLGASYICKISLHTKFQLPGKNGSNVPGWGGWLETDNRAISVQLNLTGTATGTELGKT